MKPALALFFLLVIAVAQAPVAAAQEDGEPAPVEISEEVDQPVGGIIPEPNSGVAPDDPAERGGALQLTLLALIVAFGAVAFFSVRRSSRRALAERAAPTRE